MCFNVPSQNLHWNSVSKVSCSNRVSRLNLSIEKINGLTFSWNTRWQKSLILPWRDHTVTRSSWEISTVEIMPQMTFWYSEKWCVWFWPFMISQWFHPGVFFPPFLFHNKRQSQRLHSSVKLDSMYSTLICWRSLRHGAVADINLCWLLICCRAASLSCHWVFLLHNELNQRRDGLISLYLSLQLSRVWLSHCSWLVSSVTLEKDFYSRQS